MPVERPQLAVFHFRYFDSPCKSANARPEAEPGSRGFFDVLKIYAKSQHRLGEDGKIHPWIDENLNPFTSEWLARSRLKTWQNGTWSVEKGGVERGKDYNHSTFNDIVITGLVGFRPDVAHRLITVHPLVPPGALEYFCLDDVQYAGHKLAILWDSKARPTTKGRACAFLWMDVKSSTRPTCNPSAFHCRTNPNAKPNPDVTSLR